MARRSAGVFPPISLTLLAQDKGAFSWGCFYSPSVAQTHASPKEVSTCNEPYRNRLFTSVWGDDESSESPPPLSGILLFAISAAPWDRQIGPLASFKAGIS
jgi:hypothetical protein